MPDGVTVAFVKSEFDGHLPGKFLDGREELWWRRRGTRALRDDLNDLNKEETSHYACSFLLSVNCILTVIFVYRLTSSPATTLSTWISLPTRASVLMSRATLLIAQPGAESSVHPSSMQHTHPS